jgi:hypothetical protein
VRNIRIYQYFSNIDSLLQSSLENGPAGLEDDSFLDETETVAVRYFGCPV